MALKTSLIIDLAGNLQARARQNGAALEGMAKRGQAAIRSMQSAASTLGKGLDNMAGKYTAMIGGGAAVYKAAQAVKAAANLDHALERIRSTAGAGADDVSVLRKELYEMAKQTGQSPTDLLQGFSSLIASGQTWEAALASIKAINPAMAVTGASADTLASVLNVVQEAFKLDMSDLAQAKLALDQMTVAGRLGNAELENLASIVSRVGPSAKAAGMDFGKTLAIVERLSLLEKDPARLATLTDSTLRLFTNQKYQDKMAKVTGVQTYNKDGSRRDPVEVLGEISQKYRRFKTDKERDAAIASAFGDTDLDTQKGIRTLLAEGAIEDILKMQKALGGAAGTIDRDLQSAINNSVDQVARLKAALGQAADEFSRPVNDAITRGIKYLLDEKGIGGKEMLAGGAAASLAGFGALKLGGRALMGLGTSAAGGVIGSLAKNMGLGGLKPPIPVYVVNRHMSLTREAMMGGGAPVPAGKKPPGTSGPPAPKAQPGAPTSAAGGKWLARLSRLAGPALAVGVSALDAAQTLFDSTATTAQKVEAVAETGGAAMGGWAGAAAGAAIGSVVPVVGTAIGGIIGGILGSLGGGWLAQKAAQKINESGSPEDIARALDGMSDSLETARSESVVRVEVNGGTATVQSHNGPGRVDVYSGAGYAYGSPD
jgi:TP901 family phage tail tape measure protein